MKEGYVRQYVNVTLAKTFIGEGNLAILHFKWINCYVLFDYGYGANYQCIEPETEI